MRELLHSLDGGDSDAEQAWVLEIERRTSEIADGAVELVAWDDVVAEMRDRTAASEATFSSQSSRELRAATDWYDERTGTGQKLWLAVESAVERLCAFPSAIVEYDRIIDEFTGSEAVDNLNHRRQRRYP